MIDPKNRSAAIAAAIIFVGFGIVAYFMPSLMISIGNASPILAGIFAALFVVGFFGVFWLRSRYQKRKD
ncbi:MAG: hypothetical protein ACRECW_12750 [Phyllobacterium sp.]